MLHDDTHEGQTNDVHISTKILCVHQHLHLNLPLWYYLNIDYHLPLAQPPLPPSPSPFLHQHLLLSLHNTMTPPLFPHLYLHHTSTITSTPPLNFSSFPTTSPQSPPTSLHHLSTLRNLHTPQPSPCLHQHTSPISHPFTSTTPPYHLPQPPPTPPLPPSQTSTPTHPNTTSPQHNHRNYLHHLHHRRSTNHTHHSPPYFPLICSVTPFVITIDLSTSNHCPSFLPPPLHAMTHPPHKLPITLPLHHPLSMPSSPSVHPPPLRILNHLPTSEM